MHGAEKSTDKTAMANNEALALKKKRGAVKRAVFAAAALVLLIFGCLAAWINANSDAPANMQTNVVLYRL